MNDKTQPADPLAVHRNALIIDTHADTPQRLLDQGYDLAEPLIGGHFNLASAKDGNVGAVFFAIWVEPKIYRGEYAHRALELIDAVYRQAAEHHGQLRMAFSSADILAAHREHKVAALIGIEGGHSIENSLPLLRDYYRLGARYMTLTWYNSNGWADSSGDVNDPKIPHTQDGLSDFGKDVVREMNRLGMMVDVSHVSDETFYRTLITSRAPVIASHSAARALCDSPRNMDDNMLRAISQYGGAVMVNFYSAFLSQDYRDAEQALGPPFNKRLRTPKASLRRTASRSQRRSKLKSQKAISRKVPRPPLSVLIDQIDYIAKIAGIDHVGLGSDFDGIPATPQGLDSAADLPKITQALMARGYSAQDMDKILGGNFLRVFEKVEAVSRELQSAARLPVAQQQPGER